MVAFLAAVPVIAKGALGVLTAVGTIPLVAEGVKLVSEAVTNFAKPKMNSSATSILNNVSPAYSAAHAQAFPVTEAQTQSSDIYLDANGRQISAAEYALQMASLGTGSSTAYSDGQSAGLPDADAPGVLSTPLSVVYQPVDVGRGRPDVVLPTNAYIINGR